MNEIVRYEPEKLQRDVDAFSEGLTRALTLLGLPAERVLVSNNERAKVIRNLPEVVEYLTPAQRLEAMYISKFVAACGAGLFDAALNFLWDETIVNLRKKIAKFDLGYFFDSVITDTTIRAKFRTEEDLEKLDDWDLIRGCRLTGILSEIGFKHLDYIRNMRNWASAAHPNQIQLSGLQVISWLETCIREVLAKEPEGAVMVVSRLLYNLRNQKLASSDIPAIKGSIIQLSQDLILSLLRSIFGMFTDPGLAADVKQNIRLIAPAVWAASFDQNKYEIGLKYAIFSANADIARKTLAHEFLQLVDGLPYLPPDQLTIELNEKLDNLETAHFGFDNFHTEPPHAKILAQYIPRSGIIPEAVLQKYVKTLILCRIGNGYGVSWDAMRYYDLLIERFQDVHGFAFVKLLFDSDVSSRLQFSYCVKEFKRITSDLKKRTSNVRLQSLLARILSIQDSLLPELYKDARFKHEVESLSGKL